MLAADVGISSADFAIAESGTLAVCSQAGQERAVSLLPLVHVAIVRREQVLADLFDLFERLGAGELQSSVVLITGPSKTGDIELTLTTGVHGPRQWHVILIG
jgi:L-lactate dehydrogenase complex protein LldG